MLRNQRRHNTKQPPPERCNTTRRPPNISRERLGRPSVEYSIKHTLEEILHDVQPDVGGFGCYGGEEEETYAHESRGDDHGVFAADAGEVVA